MADWTQWAADPRFWVPLAILFAYYLAVWLVKGRDPALGTIVPQYAPSAELSPAAARYLVTTGSDGRSLAAVLARLAACGCVTIEPDAAGYRITRAANPDAAKQLAPEEAAVLESMFDGDAPLHLAPSNANITSRLVAGIQKSLQQRLDGRYFTRNLRFVALGIAVSFVYALVRAVQSAGREVFVAFFLTLWVLFFMSMLGMIVCVNVVPAMRAAFRGTLERSKFLKAFAVLLAVTAMGGIGVYSLAKASSAAHAVVVLGLIVMNIAWAPALRALTAEGRGAREQLEGFRRFLVSVEQDPLNRLNQPDRPPQSKEDYLAYAIALDVREAWGDHLASTFFNAVVER